MSCGVGYRHSLDPMLLWHWCRPAVRALIRPLAWEPPYAIGVAQEMAERQKKKKKLLICIQPEIVNTSQLLKVYHSHMDSSVASFGRSAPLFTGRVTLL